MRKISILGATGSVGQNTIDLIRRDSNAYDVVALTGGANIAKLAADARALTAAVAVPAYWDRADELKAALSGTPVERTAGRLAVVPRASPPEERLL